MRGAVAASLGIACGIFVFAAGAGLTGSRGLAGLFGALAAGLAAAWFVRRGPALDPSACPRGMRLVSALATRELTTFLSCWLALNVFWPLDWPMDPRLLALLNLVPQALTVALALVALRAAPATAEAVAPTGATQAAPA